MKCIDWLKGSYFPAFQIDRHWAQTALLSIGIWLVFSGFLQACFIVGDLNGDCRVDLDDLVLSASQWMGSACQEEGLVALWKLNESSGGTAADSSGSNYNGLLAGASWNPYGGYLGGALQFDGINDYVWITQGYTGITGSAPRTCAAWIKTDRPSGEIISWGDMDAAGGGWLVRLDETGVLRVEVGSGHTLGTTVLTDDVWHHVAVVSDSSATDRISLYVDGRIEALGEGGVSQTINTLGVSTVKLGVHTDTNRYFMGLMDEVRLYNRPLSAQEVWRLTQMGTTDVSCGDLNADQTVNLMDLSKVSGNWQTQTPAIVIHEFLADNGSRSPLEGGELLDGNGESSDWIELYNQSGLPVDISGWYLTDESDQKTLWRFPAAMGGSGSGELVLAPGEYLIVFASGKTQAENPANYPYVDAMGYLHTNFQLSKEGEYLGLIEADGVTVVHEYDYSRQEENISYGDSYGEARYFSNPTPGWANDSSFTGFADKPSLSVKGGCYVEPFELVMTCRAGSFIRYTTDGTLPSLTHGTIYSGPVTISGLTTVAARSFKPGLKESEAVMETYLFLEPEVAAFNSNLPIVVIDTLGQTIPNDPVNKTPAHCRAVIIDTDAATGRAAMTDLNCFAGWGDIRRRGESTYGQGHYGFEIQDEYRQDKAVSLLGMPAESDWILSFDVIDYTLLKNEIAFKWFRDMGHYAPRQRFVEVYLNTGGGKINAGDYQGLYVLREKIKRDENRVNIARLDGSHNLEPQVSGGYIIKNDKEDTGDTVLVLETSPYGIIIDGNTSIVEPGPLEVTRSQIDWVVNYMNQFHAVLWQNTSSTYYVPGVDYTDYVDEVSWIDHGIVEQIGNDSDAFRFSYFIHKDRGGKLFSGPPWDYDRSFHNSGSSARPYTGWRVEYKIPGKWHLGLQQYLEYKMMLADRWFEHREKVLNTAETLAYIDEMAALMSEARARPQVKYYPRPFAEEIQLFKDWISNRLDVLDGEVAARFAERPPVFSLSGGYVSSVDSLTISKPSGVSGTIYYTLDGTDPRQEGGSVHPSARIYQTDGTSQPLVTMGSSVWKYLYDGSNQGTAWRMPGFNDASWGSGAGQLGFGDNDETTPIGPKVNGRRCAYFRHTFTVSNVSQITALTASLVYDDGAVVYLNNQEIGRIDMPDGTIAFNTLSNGGNKENAATVFSGISLSLLNEGANILAVEVHQVADDSTDLSFDLSLTATRTSSGSAPLTFDKSMCVTARILNGTAWSARNKETYAVGPVSESLRITELMYHPADPNTEFIEVQNIGTETLNLNLVQFTEGVQFTFGDTSLVPGQYALIVEDLAAFTGKYGEGLNVAGQYTGRLDNDGDRITLTDALGSQVQSFNYKDNWYELTDGAGFSLTSVNPAGEDLEQWGRKTGWRSSLSAGGTPGGEDQTLTAGSIVINEVLAHSHDTSPDWIELYNTTGQDIHIGGWFLSDDDSDPNLIRKYEIPAGTVIEAYDYLVFVEDTSFGESFGLSEGGEAVYLYSGQDGRVTGYYTTQQSFDASESGVTFGRYEKAELSNGYDFTRMFSATPAAVNSGPRISPVVMTEIYYNPPSGTDYEYVELYNRSGFPVTLMTAATTETSPGVFVTEAIAWRLEGTGYEFPAGVTLGVGERILVAKNPAMYAGVSCRVYGPYDGKLDNGGEEIELQMPGDQEYGRARYWIPVERVEYKDTAPWPTGADGSGLSLERVNAGLYANDYSNWQAAAPTPGE